jgi:hypothetical protein
LIAFFVVVTKMGTELARKAGAAGDASDDQGERISCSLEQKNAFIFVQWLSKRDFKLLSTTFPKHPQNALTGASGNTSDALG